MKMNLKKSQYKIVFFGTPDFVTPVLNALSKNFEVVGAIRKQIEFNDQTIKALKSLNPDFFVVASFGQILSDEVVSIPKLASVNIHPSLLPKYRGPSPIQSQILEGETKTGVTFIKMDEQIDHGPIIKQIKSETTPDDTFESLAKRLFQKSADELPEILNNYDEDKLIIQSETDATFTKLLTKEDGFIDLETLKTGNLIFDIQRAIRALYPWPGVWTKYNLSNKEIIIKLLPFGKIQVEGKKPMSYKDFMNGYDKGKFLLEKLNLI